MKSKVANKKHNGKIESSQKAGDDESESKNNQPQSKNKEEDKSEHENNGNVDSK